MTYVVAFDNSALSRAALERAVTFADATGADVVAVTVIPRDAEVARERGWIGDDEDFSVDAAARTLADAVAEFDPAVGFEYSAVDKYAPRGRVSREVRALAIDADASVVFVGSDNAGRMVTSLGSVAQNVTADDRYDVHIVRHADRDAA